MNESGHIQAIHRKLPPWIYGQKLRVAGAAGVPDCYYESGASDPGRILWVEYKLIDRVPKQSKQLSVTPAQRGWLRRAANHAIPAWLVILTNEGPICVREVRRIFNNCDPFGPVTPYDFYHGWPVKEMPCPDRAAYIERLARELGP